MKKAWILLIALSMLLTGCGRQETHPEWPEDWTRFGDRLAVESPEDFAPGEFNDALSLNGIWYATWICGEPRAVQTDGDEEATAYDAQIFVSLQECPGAEQAEKTLESYLEIERQHYETDEPSEKSIGGQRFVLLPLNAVGADNPYSHGAAAFAVRGDMVFSVELLCAEGFEGDPQEILERFVSGIHYGE